MIPNKDFGTRFKFPGSEKCSRWHLWNRCLISTNVYGVLWCFFQPKNELFSKCQFCQKLSWEFSFLAYSWQITYIEMNEDAPLRRETRKNREVKCNNSNFNDGDPNLTAQRLKVEPNLSDYEEEASLLKVLMSIDFNGHFIHSVFLVLILSSSKKWFTSDIVK